MKARREGNPTWQDRIRPWLLGVLTAILVAGLSLLITALLMTFLDMPSFVSTVLSVLSAALGAFVGGLMAARLSGKQGFFMGLLVGLSLFLLVLITGLLIHRRVQIGFLFIKLAVLLVCGMAGGMIGVNKK